MKDPGHELYLATLFTKSYNGTLVNTKSHRGTLEATYLLDLMPCLLRLAKLVRGPVMYTLMVAF